MMERHSPLVSIIIPMWNTGSSAIEVVKKLLQQPYRQIEILVIDDGSTDDSLKQLQDLQTKTKDARLKVYHQANAGPSAARNHGLEKMRGDYVCFIDSDDGFDEQLITKLAERIEHNPKIALVGTSKQYIDLNTDTTKIICATPRRAQRADESLAAYAVWLMLLDGRLYSVTGKVYRAEPIRKHKIRFAEDWNFAEDTRFVLDYLAVADGEIDFILEPLYWYNFGTETSIVKHSALNWKNWQKSYRHLREWSRGVEKKLQLKTRVLLGLIYLRWRVSHYRSQKRARKAKSK